MGTVLSVQVGVVSPLGAAGVPSGFVKRPVAGKVRVRKLGLDGDAQADLTVHGGEEKAVYAYAAAHYALWVADFPEHAAKLSPGAFGENLTVEGLEERHICGGDVHGVGSAVLQVCQPRQPCFKFALRFDDKRMPRAMVRSGRSGWYYRVIEEGEIAAGDEVRLVSRPNPELGFQSLVNLIYGGEASEDLLSLIAEADGVARWLRVGAKRALSGSSLRSRD